MSGRAADPRRRDWDFYTKQAVRAGLDGVLTRAGIPADAVASLVPQTVELPTSTHRADLVYAAPDGLVVHVEIQQVPDPAMGRRMAGYAVRISDTEPFLSTMRDLVQILVQISGPAMPERHRMGRLTNEVTLLHVPSTPAGEFLRTPALAPFALAGRDGAEAVIDEVMDGIAEVADADLQVTLVTLSLYLVPRLGRTIMERLRRADMNQLIEVLRDTEFGHWLKEEGAQEGERRGEQRGERRGEQRGRQIERRAAAVEILSFRFPDADLARIELTADRIVAEEHERPAAAALAVVELDS